MANIIKKVAKGLMKGVEEIGEKEAYEAASKIAKGMDKDVEHIAKKNLGKINDIVTQDIKHAGEKFNLTDYLKTNSFQNVSSIENSINSINKKNKLISGLAESKILNYPEIREAYNKFENNPKFKLRADKADFIKSSLYESKATKDEVFSKYYDNYKSVKRANKNVTYDLDMNTKKEMFGDRMRRDYSSTTKEFKNFSKDYKSGKMDEPINQRIDSLIGSSDSLDDMLYGAYASDRDFNIRQAASRAENTSSTTMDEAINKKKHQTFEEYTKNKYDKQFEDSWNKYKNASAEERTKMNSDFGIGEEGNAREKMREHFDKAQENGGAFGVGDKMAYYKVPQKAVGIGATAWMVSKMFGSRGQMDNQQLYGQQQPYNGNPQY